MQRIASMMLATAVVGASLVTSAQAAGTGTPYLGSLDFGVQGSFIQPVTPQTAAFAYEAQFNLEHDSTLIGTLFGIRSGAATVTESWFNEGTGQTESRTWARTIVFDEQPFDLGTLPGTADIASISPSMYSLKLSGVLADGYVQSGAAFTLSVQPAVPEPGTWALMGLGLVGVAAAARRRTQA